jgi:uncharacterized iron-regulated membrane protein
MTFNLFARKLHYWTSIIIALPVLLIISTGVLLQLKKQWSWVQPPERRGTGTVPAVDFDGILASIRSVPELGVSSWQDVRRLDVRPGRGMVKAWLESGWEVQIDLGTGRVLQTAYRRSDLIEALHDGSFFVGDWSKLGLFLPSGFALLVLWSSGLWMFWLPISVRRRRARAAMARPIPDR